MIEKLSIFLLFVIGVVMGIILAHKTPDYQDGSYDKIVACEKSLTRDQHCMLVAVPEETNK